MSKSRGVVTALPTCPEIRNFAGYLIKPLHDFLAKSDEVERLADRLRLTLCTQNFLRSPEYLGVEKDIFSDQLDHSSTPFLMYISRKHTYAYISGQGVLAIERRQPWAGSMGKSR